MTLYNAIGQGYNSTRQPDSRIVEQLIAFLALPLGSTIADIGAGTGNYSTAIANRGYQVVAIEPSAVMQSQAQPHPQVNWLTASAEAIPLPDNAVDGAIVMLALHHFQNLAQGISEIDRINKTGKTVIFAFEQSKIPDFWLTEYFPYFIGDTLATFPEPKAIASLITQITQQPVKIIPFLLPKDLSDRFAAAGWCQPEIYLQPEVRAGISSFSKMPVDELQAGIAQLQADLNSGIWLQKYGYLQQQPEYDAGYRIFVVG